jgi:hypothetical protein
MQQLEEFARDRSKASGYKSHCKDCDNAKSKRYYAANGERVRARINSRNAELRRGAEGDGQDGGLPQGGGADKTLRSETDTGAPTDFPAYVDGEADRA